MSVPQRAYNLLRGYIGREFDRIQGVDKDAAAEFAEAMSNPLPPEVPKPAPVSPMTPVDRRARACSILGVEDNADFSMIHAAYTRLNRRSDPANFPPGSSEAKQAKEIQRRVQEAYRVLADQADSTEVRFRSLELD